MKESPDKKKLQEVLRSSTLAAGGFMGDDERSIDDVIETDAAEVEKLGCDLKKIAARMTEITDITKPLLGNYLDIGEGLEAKSEDFKGMIACPWPHPSLQAKRITTVKVKETLVSIRWSDLNIHLIAEHGFFEGKGSAFRVEPGKLIEIIFKKT